MTSTETGQGINDFVAGFASGAAGVFAGHPFETTKVQIQGGSMSVPFKGYTDAGRTIAQHGMVRGFFRGMSFPLITQGLMNCLAFGVAGKTLSIFREATNKDPNYFHIFVAGSLGGAAGLFVQVPTELVKTVLQSQIPREKGIKVGPSGHYFKGPFQCFSHIYKQNGVRGLYRGMISTGLRDSPGVGLYYMYYHICYDVIDKMLGGKDKYGILQSLLGGGIAGCVNWATIMPLDVVKTHMQADHDGTRYRGVLDCMRQIYHKGGIKAFYRGVVMACARGFPVGVAEFFVYTHILRIMNYSLRDKQI